MKASIEILKQKGKLVDFVPSQTEDLRVPARDAVGSARSARDGHVVCVRRQFAPVGETLCIWYCVPFCL